MRNSFITATCFRNTIVVQKTRGLGRINAAKSRRQFSDNVNALAKRSGLNLVISERVEIHSEWEDEAAFNLHARLPHKVRFLQVAERLTGKPVQGLRAREIA